MATIPTDVITDFILPNLPAKSLVRFKCVSKSFNTLISSPEFIDDHFRRSQSSNANRLLIFSKKDTSNLHLIDVESSNTSTIVDIPLPSLKPLDKYHRQSIILEGSFNGLLLVGQVLITEWGTQKISNHVLINPCTGEYRPISYNEYNADRLSFGFGYDDLNDDYKLVCVSERSTYYRPYFIADRVFNRKVMVYSLNKDEWKSVEGIDTPPLTLNLMSDKPKGVLVKNHLLHWVFYGLETYHICCFDVRSEKWVDGVPLMDMFTYPVTDELQLKNLDVLDDCLSLWTRTSIFANNGFCYSIAVWIMKEYGVQESWIKLFEISCRYPMCSYPFDVPFGFRNGLRREFLLRDPDKIKSPLYRYDIDSKTFDMSEIKGVPGGFEDACFLKGSLVKIPGGRPIQDQMNKI